MLDVIVDLSRETKIQVGVAVGTFLLSTYLVKKIRQRKYNLPPGPYPLPVLGNLLAFRNADPVVLFRRFQEQYGDACTLYIGSQPMILLSSPDLIREAFIKEGASVSERPESYTAELFTDGYKDVAFGMYSDPVWKLQRKIIHKALRKYGGGQKSEVLAHRSVELAGNYFVAQKGPFDPDKIISWMIYNIICTMCFGEETTGIEDPFFVKVSTLIDEINYMAGSGLPPDYFPFLRYFPLPILKTFSQKIKELYLIFDDTWQKHVASYDPENVVDFTHQLIEMQEEASQTEEDASVLAQFTHEHFLQLLYDVFFAGTDTTRITLFWFFQYMAINPDVQRKVQEEIDSVLGSDRLMTLSDRASLPYAEATLREVMRLRPVAGVAIPHSTLHDVTLGEYHIPKGTQVVPNFFSISQDERYFEEPLKLKPERFLDENGKIQKNEAFLPFSVGKRACPGERLARNELHILVVSLLQKFTISAPPGEILSAKCKDIALGCVPEPFKITMQKRT